MFGLERSLEVLRGSADAAEDVARLVDAVVAHAQGLLADDVTVSSVCLSAG